MHGLSGPSAVDRLAQYGGSVKRLRFFMFTILAIPAITVNYLPSRRISPEQNYERAQPNPKYRSQPNRAPKKIFRMCINLVPDRHVNLQVSLHRNFDSCFRVLGASLKVIRNKLHEIFVGSPTIFRVECLKGIRPLL